jgi:peptidyl-prolyl cis-trans isomerase SurA
MRKYNPILIIFLSFLTTLVYAQKPEGAVIDQVVAVVGNKVVLQSDVENQYLQNQAQGIYYPDMKCRIMEDMLYQKLLVNQSEIDSVEVTKMEVDMELDARLNTFISQVGSEHKLEEYFNKTIDEIKEDFRDIIQDQLLSRRMQNEIAGEIKVTPSEVTKYYESLPQDSLPVVPTEVELQQIAIYPEITREQKHTVKEELEKLRERILSGEKFSVLARLYSEDPGSASKGGDLGFVNRTDLVPEFAAVAFNLEPGEISRIVETDYGFHVIQLIEKRGEQVNVKHILKSPKAPPGKKIEAKMLLDSVARLIKQDSVSFDEAATRFSQDEQSKNNNGLVVNPYTGTSRFEMKQLDPATTYAIKNQKLKEGDISKPFEGIDQKGQPVYKIIKIKSLTKSHVANLKDDYQRIQDLALREKKKKIVDKWVEQRQKDTYIRIVDDFKDCPFEYKGWIKY